MRWPWPCDAEEGELGGETRVAITCTEALRPVRFMCSGYLQQGRGSRTHILRAHTPQLDVDARGPSVLGFILAHTDTNHVRSACPANALSSAPRRCANSAGTRRTGGGLRGTLSATETRARRQLTGDADSEHSNLAITATLALTRTRPIPGCESAMPPTADFCP